MFGNIVDTLFSAAFWTAVATIAIACFTWTLKRSTDRLWQAAKDQIVAAENAAKIQSADMNASIAVAKEAADAAKLSADVAERALVDIQRALVVPTHFESTVMVNNGQVIAYRITAIFENTGTTVAKRFTGTSNIVVFDGLLPDDFRYPDRTEVARPIAFVGPRVPVPFPILIAFQDIIDIMNKSKRGFFYGWVEYIDIFKEMAMRRTEFCVQIEIVGNPMIVPDKGTPSILSFGVYGKYNGTDEDCFYKPGQRPPIGGLPPPTQLQNAGLSGPP